MAIRCESDDGRMTKTGELLDCADGELREELECEDCGATSAIYYTRDGNELLEDGAYSDRELAIDIEGDDKTVEWEGQVKHDSWATSYDRSASLNMTIDGPDGELVVIASYRAMIDDDNDLMDSGTIKETRQFYRPGETEPFHDSSAEWDVPVDDLESPREFVEEARAAAEADPQLEYEQRMEDD